MEEHDSRARHFGKRVRAERRRQGLRQEDLAMVSGVGRRFLIELEAGKSTCRLGPSLAVAAALGLNVLPDISAEEELDVSRTRPTP